ncbi:MAG: cutinase family protein [Candidatus Saccharimonadales bacterium]
MIFFAVAFNVSRDTSALEVDSSCSDVNVIFARGSGQDLQGTEAKRFISQVKSRLGKGAVTGNFYELGTEKYGDSQYEAVTVRDWHKNGNIIGAKISSGYANDYGKSVDSGVVELQNYLIQRTEKCPNEKVILGGYSQGAQVVGQALPSLLPNQLSKIEFVALFGDPKLYLPEGEGMLPDACRGKNHSDWRRIIDNCLTDNGTLGARKPYVSSALKGKVGLWCRSHDFICGSSKILGDDAGHSKYKDEKGDIDLAAHEIAVLLKSKLPADKAATIDVEPVHDLKNLSALDVALIINTTSITPERLEQNKAVARIIASQVKAVNGRVGLVEYYGGTNHSMGMHATPLSADQTAFQLTLSRLYVQPALPDVRETLVNSMLETLEVMDWQYGAGKAMVIMSDGILYSPDPITGAPLSNVVELSAIIDPVGIYPILPHAANVTIAQELAEATAGKVIDGTSEEATRGIVASIIAGNQSPVVQLKIDSYRALPAEEITFDASDSYVLGSTIAQYEWDFDGDGIFDQTTTEPVVNYTYPAPFIGEIRVQATAVNTFAAIGTAKVEVGEVSLPVTPQAPLQVAATIDSTVAGKSAVTLSWQSADALASSWVIAVNGVALGTVAGDRTSIQVTDIDRSQDVELSVAGVSAEQELGAAATVAVAKAVTPPAPVKKPSFFSQLFKYIKKVITSFYSIFHR